MSEPTPRVSIGLPVFNGERYLEETLQSILGQTLGDLEIVISDNGSTDHTAEICRAIAAQDRRVRYHRSERNRGGAWNHNRVFALSRGEYFKWAAHDDLLAPEFLERCVRVLDAVPAYVLCTSRAAFVDERGAALRRSDASLDLEST